MDDHVQVAELDVVALDQVEVVGAETVQALADTAFHARGGEVEVLVSVPADLGGQHVAGTSDPLQGLAEDGLGSRGAVVGRHIEEIDTQVECGQYRVDAVLFGEGAGDRPQGRGAEAQFRHFDAGPAQRVAVHEGSSVASVSNGVR